MRQPSCDSKILQKSFKQSDEPPKKKKIIYHSFVFKKLKMLGAGVYPGGSNECATYWNSWLDAGPGSWLQLPFNANPAITVMVHVVESLPPYVGIEFPAPSFGLGHCRCLENEVTKGRVLSLSLFSNKTTKNVQHPSQTNLASVLSLKRIVIFKKFHFFLSLCDQF